MFNHHDLLVCLVGTMYLIYVTDSYWKVGYFYVTWEGKYSCTNQRYENFEFWQRKWDIWNSLPKYYNTYNGTWQKPPIFFGPIQWVISILQDQYKTTMNHIFYNKPQDWSLSWIVYYFVHRESDKSYLANVIADSLN